MIDLGNSQENFKNIKTIDELLNYLCGDSTSSDYFKEKCVEFEVSVSDYKLYKAILKYEFNNCNLLLSDVENRLNDLFKLNIKYIFKLYENEEDTSEMKLDFINSKTKITQNISKDCAEDNNFVFDEGLNFCTKCGDKLTTFKCDNCGYNFLLDLSGDFHQNNENFLEMKEGELLFSNIEATRIETLDSRARYSFGNRELLAEEYAIEYYRSLKYNAIWTENDYWWVLFSLLFWEDIFKGMDRENNFPEGSEEYEERLSFLERFDMPHDFFKPSFYINRKESIDSKLKKIKKGNIFNEIINSYNKNYKKPCRSIENWEKYSLKELLIAPYILKNEQFAIIMESLVKDFTNNRSGFPDLLVFNNYEVFFSEVKSKNDKIQDSQIRCQNFLRNKVKMDIEYLCINKTDLQFFKLQDQLGCLKPTEEEQRLFEEGLYSIEDMADLKGADMYQKHVSNIYFAKQYELDGNMEEAIKLYKANIKNRYNTHQKYVPYERLYNIYMDRKDYSEALKISQRAIGSLNGNKNKKYRDKFRERIKELENTLGIE